MYLYSLLLTLEGSLALCVLTSLPSSTYDIFLDQLHPYSHAYSLDIKSSFKPNSNTTAPMVPPGGEEQQSIPNHNLASSVGGTIETPLLNDGKAAYNEDQQAIQAVWQDPKAARLVSDERGTAIMSYFAYQRKQKAEGQTPVNREDFEDTETLEDRAEGLRLWVVAKERWEREGDGKGAEGRRVEKKGGSQEGILVPTGTDEGKGGKGGRSGRPLKVRVSFGKSQK